MHERLGTFSSTTLAGDERAVPRDLERATVLFFAYRQHQQAHVDSWLRVLGGDDRVDVLEVPLLGRRWLPARPVIDGGMASNMDLATRQQTMCVYTDVRGFQQRVLGVTSREVLAVLVDPSGTVLWHAFGPSTVAGAADLQDAVERCHTCR